MSCAVMRTRPADLRTLPSRMRLTSSFHAASARGFRKAYMARDIAAWRARGFGALRGRDGQASA